MNKINIQDESEDKKYFTIIPNYILNHSTLWDREVYIQMKRISGENGTCWTSRNTLAKQCGMSPRRLDKSIKYLLEHTWIKSVGKKEVITKGGVQEVNEYKIINLWNINNEFYQEKYKGVAPNDIPLTKGVAQKEQRGSTVETKGVALGAHKEELIQEKPSNKINTVVFSEFNNVKLTNEEHGKLVEKLGDKNTAILIEELGGYMKSTGKKYIDHYATILNWARRKMNNYQDKKNSRSKSIAIIQ